MMWFALGFVSGILTVLALMVMSLWSLGSVNPPPGHGKAPRE